MNKSEDMCLVFAGELKIAIDTQLLGHEFAPLRSLVDYEICDHYLLAKFSAFVDFADTLVVIPLCYLESTDVNEVSIEMANHIRRKLSKPIDGYGVLS